MADLPSMAVLQVIDSQGAAVDPDVKFKIALPDIVRRFIGKFVNCLHPAKAGRPRRASNALPLFSLCLLLQACEPIHPPPDGWVESCYGGSFRKTLNGSVPHVTIRLNVKESDWPKLHTDLSKVGHDLGLDVIDSSLNLSHVRVFGLGICSSEGLYIKAGAQIWTNRPGGSAYKGVNIGVHSYTDTFNWTKSAVALVEMIEEKWADVSEIEWRDSPNDWRPD